MLELQRESHLFTLAGESIQGDIAKLAELTVERQMSSSPDMREKLGGVLYEKSVEDTSRPLCALAQALLVDEPTLFASYVIWAEVVLSNLGLPDEWLTGSMIAIRDTLGEALPAPLARAAAEYIDIASETLTDTLADLRSTPHEVTPLTGTAVDYLEALLAGDRDAAADVVREAVAAGAVLPDLYEHVFRASQHEIGLMWQSNRVSVAMEHYATGATEAIMLANSGLESSRAGGTRRFLGACVEGEQHDMAIRMVCDVLRAEGWDTFFLGASTPASTLAQALAEFRPTAVGLSATWLFNVEAVRDAVRAIREMDPDVKVIVGGAPFDNTPGLAEKLGADARGGSLLELPTQLDRLIGWSEPPVSTLHEAL